MPGSEPFCPFDLRDRVVVVTGGAHGIGRVYCERFADLGARIVVADIDGKTADRTAETIAARGGTAIAATTDVSQPASAEDLAGRALAAFGRIDVLINNAALMSGLPRRPWHEIPVAEWDGVMAVNLRGPFLCARAVFPAMRAQGKGKIVNISSSRVWDGTPLRLHYTASKAGIVGFTRALARELGEFNVTVNAVTPGLTLSENQLASTAPDYLARNGDSRRALRRAQVPGDVVGAVLFLASDASDFITGQTINVDGGLSMH